MSRTEPTAEDLAIEKRNMEEIDKRRLANIAIGFCEGGGPVDENGNSLINKEEFAKYRMPEMDARHAALMAYKPSKMSTWTIPKEAPPGWGMGRGLEWLRENPDVIPKKAEAGEA